MINQYEVTRARVKEWVKDSMFRMPRLLFFILFMILGLFFVGAAIFFTTVSLIFAPESFGLMNVFLFLVGVFALYHALFHHFVIASRQYTHLAKTFGGENWIRTVDFSDETITVREGSTEIKFAYTEISQIREKGDLITLETANRNTVRLYASAFTQGDWKTCRALLEKEMTP